MKLADVTKVVLCIAGLLAVGIGGVTLISPATIYGSYQITIGENASMLSEIRASGGGLLAFGLVIIAGAFIARLTFTSLLVSSVLFLAYGAARILSMAVDGMPADPLVHGTIFEIVIGAICLFLLTKLQQDSKGLETSVS